MKWRIVVDHINVNAGDSTLIQLFSQKEKQEKLVKAILIDAGLAVCGRSRVIPFLQEMKKQQEFKDSNTPFLLDVIVVTHYDRDHLGGIVELLENQYQKLKTTNSMDLLKVGANFYDPGKYEDDGKDSTNIYKSYKEKIEKLVKAVQITHKTPFNTAGSTLLGHELFHDQKMSFEFGFHEDIKALQRQISEKSNRIRIGDYPSPLLLCVAVNKDIIQTPTPRLKSTADVKIVPGLPDNTTDKNQRSIALILFSAKPKALHYLPGDLGVTIEEKIVAWMQPYFDNGERMNTIKFAHHGAKTSTPQDLITKSSPSFGIISAGSKYSHPTPELLLYLADYSGKGISNASKRQKTAAIKVYATNYPYYLINEAIFESVFSKLKFDGNRMDTILTKGSKSYLIAEKKNTEIKLSEMCDLWENIPGLPDPNLNYFCTEDSKTPTTNMHNRISHLIMQEESNNIPDGDSTAIAPDGEGSTTKKRKHSTTLTKINSAEKVYQIVNHSLLPTAAKNIIQPTLNNNLDQFIGVLKSNCLTLNEVTLTYPSTTTFSATGTIADTIVNNANPDYFASWLHQSMALTVTINVTGQVKNNQLVNAELTENIQATIIPPASTTPFKLKGSLQKDNILLFSEEKLTASAASLLNFTGYEDGGILNLLESVFKDALSSLTVGIQIAFDPCAGWDYATRTRLVTTPDSKNVTIGGLPLQISPSLILQSEIRPDAINPDETGDNIIESVCQRYSAKLISQFAFSSTITPKLEIAFNPDGWSKFAIKVIPDQLQPLTIMNTLFDKLLPESTVVTDFLKFIDNIQMSLPKLTAVILTFSNEFKFVNAELVGRLEFKKLGADLDLHCLFPPGKIYGNLHDDDQPDNKINFSSLLKAHDIDSPDSKQLDQLALTNLSFMADPSSDSYQFSADMSDSDWQFCDEIKLTGLSVNLGYESKIFYGNITCFLFLDGIPFIVEGQYNQKQWQLSATISSLNITQLISLLPNDIEPALTDALPSTMLIKDLALTLNASTKTFYFSATVVFGSFTALLNFALFAGNNSTHAKRYFFSLEVPLPNRLAQIPMVGNIDSPINSLQFIATTGNLQPGDLPQNANSNVILLATNNSLAKGATLMALVHGVSKPVLLPLTKPQLSESKGLIDSTSVSAPLWIKLGKTFGPLHVQRLGFSYSYQQQKLRLLLDGSVRIGPLTTQLMGLGVGIPFEHLSDLDSWGFYLEGMGLSYQTGPMSLAGSFLKDDNNPSRIVKVRYTGAALLSLEEFTLAAIGSYAKFTAEYQAKTHQDCSVFVFARVNYPFGGPPFFYITGLAGGFGYNQNLRIPTQDQVVNFPLVQGSVDPTAMGGPGADLITIEQQLLGDSDNPAWINPQAGIDWLAIGIDFTTFELIGTRALAVLEMGQDFQLAVLGRSVLSLPKSGTSIAYVEMGLEAVFNPGKGIFGMTAVLSPNSYVLTPDCHLTGGFAFFSWLKDQQGGAQAGDFVTTLGGYHPSFPCPAWYPKVPRLGFSWHVSDNILIDGEAYAALTSSAVMMGGLLQALFQCGGLKAWFKTGADFLIEWHPFQFQGDIDISVGASYRLDLLFTSVTLGFEIGAALKIWGPPTGGKVKVDLWVISFTIPFGADQDPTPTISWNDFRQFLPSDSQQNETRSIGKPKKSSTNILVLNRIFAEKGLAKQITEPDQTVRWVVRGNKFCFHTETAIPASQITLNEKVISYNGQESCPIPLYAKPMRAGFKHTHDIQIDQANNQNPGGWLPVDIDDQWQYSVILHNLPDALWGSPADQKESQQDADNLYLLERNLVKNCWVGLKIQMPEAQAGVPLGPIDIKNTFGEVIAYGSQQQNGCLPLKTKSPTSLQPQQNPQSLETITDSSSGIAAVCQQRNTLVDKLQTLGFFRPLTPLNNMKAVAKSADQIFSAPPLVTAPPSSTLWARRRGPQPIRTSLPTVTRTGEEKCIIN